MVYARGHGCGTASLLPANTGRLHPDLGIFFADFAAVELETILPNSRKTLQPGKTTK